MAERNQQVLEMVRNELAKNPGITNDALLAAARAIDPKLRRLRPQQFHGIYRLPATRTLKKQPKPADGNGATPVSVAETAAPRSTALPARQDAMRREAVREVLAGVVRDALSTDDRAAFIKLLDRLDERAVAILAIFGRE